MPFLTCKNIEIQCSKETLECSKLTNNLLCIAPGASTIYKVQQQSRTNMLVKA